MRGSLGGPRVLLRRLREVMAEPVSAQERLDKIVVLIAANMVAEVCSVYVLRVDSTLELYATEGLNRDAVHHTVLGSDEGLVGLVSSQATAINLSNAQAHPAFAYRPETGEEVYHSLMGVPILRSGRVSGVLVVQNRSQRHYTDEEIEALQTVAMVLAELVAAGALVDVEEQHPTDGIATLPHRLDGVRLNSGLAIGTAVLHQPAIVIRQLVAEDPEAESLRLDLAIDEMQRSIDRMLSSSELAHGGEHRDILETYRMFAEDRGWLGRIREAVESGLTAEAAVQKVRDDTRARMKQISDPYIRERLTDLEDLANRLQHHLSGGATTAAVETEAEDVVLVARNMGPAELMDYDRKRLRALVLEEGSPTAHVAVVARALDIPVVGRVKGAIAQIDPGDQVVVDGDNAQVLVRPSEDVQAAVENRLAERRTRKAAYEALRELPAVTLDGVAIGLFMNAGLLIDLPELEATRADGIGLYRTELPFMTRHDFPNVIDQTELYTRVLDQAQGRPVVFRTLDIGGDKVLPYLPETVEENPAMGWRALRISLDHPAMLRQQLRALLLAANGRPLSVMFPMVAEVAELVAARRILDMELRQLERRGQPLPSSLRVGAMLEVPALIWQLDGLCRLVDFVSVGSNDLMQFLFAKDRGNARLAERYDVLAPAALSCLAEIVRAADRGGVTLSLCGEMASSPVEAMALIGLGFRNLSMSPSAIGPIKAMIRTLDVAPLRQYLADATRHTSHSLRQKLREFARDHGVSI